MNVNGYNCVTANSLPGQDPLAKVVRTELGRRRSLGDEQCFIISLRANRGRRSGWTIEFQSQGMVTWINNRLGIIGGDWQTARRAIAIIKKDRHYGGIMLHSAALEPDNHEGEVTEFDETLVFK